jgi:hypothetical protein
MIVCWWSGGITSAVACKKAIDRWDATPVYIETGSHHPDTLRFKKDCEQWYGKEILTIQTTKYADHFDVIEKDNYVNGPAGARCTLTLKRRVRELWEKTQPITGYVWGFESGAKEEGRADRIKTAQPNYQHYFPLIEDGLSKKDCIVIVQSIGIEIPEMYKLGFNNNNCVGCVKGGMAYWNMIRKHFPEQFDKMAKLERKVGRSCLSRYYLDELPPDAGRGTPPLVADCGATGEGCITSLSRDYYNRE